MHKILTSFWIVYVINLKLKNIYISFYLNLNLLETGIQQ